MNRLNVNVGTVTGVSRSDRFLPRFYANGFTAEQIQAIFIDELASLPAPSLVRALLLPSCVGRITGKKTGGGLVDLPELFSHLIAKYNLKPQPNLRVIAFNVFTGRPVVFEGTDCDLLTALCASCAVPVLMRPVWFGQNDAFGKLSMLTKGLKGINGHGLLIDGGVHHPYPGTFCKGPAIIGKLGFATALPKHRLSRSDMIMHLMEMAAAPSDEQAIS